MDATSPHAVSPSSPPLRNSLTAEGRPKFCIRCGEQNKSFRTKKALRCADCDPVAKSDRSTFEKRYHLARSRATSVLINRHHEEFHEILVEERRKVERVERAAAKKAQDRVAAAS